VDKKMKLWKAAVKC